MCMHTYIDTYTYAVMIRLSIFSAAGDVQFCSSLNEIVIDRELCETMGTGGGF
jgi:hypothetical protein